jgi:hypothetical protein
VKIIYTKHHANRHTSAACDNRCLVNTIDTVDILAAYLVVTADTIYLNTRDGRDITPVPGRVAASSSLPSRVKTRLSPIYAGGSKSFRPDQIFKVTNKTTLILFNIAQRYQLPVHRCQKCVEIKGDYIEKWQSCFISVTFFFFVIRARGICPRCTAACRFFVLPLYRASVLDVPTFRCQSVLLVRATRESPSSERWKCLGENNGR